MHWLPSNGSLHGLRFDQLLRWNLYAIFALFLLANLLLLAALFRRRAAHSAAENPPRSPLRFILLAELLPLIAVAALYVWMEITGHRLWAITHEQADQPSALPVEVTGVQFQWYFRYPGPDGSFGTLRPALVSAPAGNPLGLDPHDPHSLDDVVSPILVLPAGRRIDLTLHS